MIKTKIEEMKADVQPPHKTDTNNSTLSNNIEASEFQLQLWEQESSQEK